MEYHDILYTIRTMRSPEISILPCTELEFDLSTGSKVGKNNASPVLMPSGELSSFVGGVSVLAPTTTIQGVFSALNRKFDTLY